MKGFKEFILNKLDSVDGTSSDAVISLPIQLTMYDKRISNPHRLRILSNDPLKNLEVHQAEYILICLFWKMMDYDTEYIINYQDVLRLVSVSGKGCKQEPIGRNIKGIIYQLGKQGLFKINKLGTHEATLTKLNGDFGDYVQETHFHINDIKMLCCDELTYTMKCKLVSLLVKIKFSMFITIKGKKKEIFFVGYKYVFSDSLHMDVKTLSSQLEKLERYHTIFVYTQEKFRVNNKYRYGELMIRDAGSEIAHQANRDLGYSIWVIPTTN